MREKVYSLHDDEFHEIEMKKILDSSDWFCYFLTSENNQILGMVDLSSRNIVDGCLSSPVAYLEGLYLKKRIPWDGAGERSYESHKKLVQK